eukprot:2263165-Pyramimonas_sp.AAC.1
MRPWRCREAVSKLHAKPSRNQQNRLITRVVTIPGDCRGSSRSLGCHALRWMCAMGSNFRNVLQIPYVFGP